MDAKIGFPDASPLLNTWTDGLFEAVEKEAGVVPYSIGGEAFHKLFALADESANRLGEMRNCLLHGKKAQERMWSAPSASCSRLSSEF